MNLVIFLNCVPYHFIVITEKRGPSRSRIFVGVVTWMTITRVIVSATNSMVTTAVILIATIISCILAIVAYILS